VPRWGANGFLVMVMASNLFTSVLNLNRLVKITGLKLRIGEWVVKPVLAAMASCQIIRVICNFYLFEQLPMWLGLSVGIAVITCVYIVVLFSIGALSFEDFSWITEQLKSTRGTLKAEPEKSYYRV